MKTEINITDKEKFERRYWLKMINCLSGFKSANLVGSISKDGHTNLSIISSAVHLGAAPPLVGFVLRPHSDESPRHTFMNILETGYYSLNHITPDFFKNAHQTSARYDRNISEFEACNIPSDMNNNFNIPLVKNSPLQIILEKKEIIDISLNDTKFIIGEIVSFHVDDQFIHNDGYIDIEAMNSVCVSGLDSYHTTKRLNRMSYAKPDAESHPID